jgi:tetratricopeptide (TPR) repeat protein
MFSRDSSLLMVCIVCMAMWMPVLHAVPLNISGVIRDSLSHDSLPFVKITITEFGKSFTTTRSGFFVALEPSTYTFLLEADAYESLKKELSVSTEGETFTFDMVKSSDRAKLDKRSDSLFLFQEGFYYAIAHQQITDAYAYMVACKRFSATGGQLDSMMTVYNAAKGVWIDSIFTYALALEDSQKVSDAYYYYKKILSVDSLHEGAREHYAKTEGILTAILEGKTPVSTGGADNETPARMTPEQIQGMFNQAVNKFLEEDYEGALILLKTILKNDPNHEGAKNYLSRTQARLQIK